MVADTQGTCQVCFHTQKLPNGVLSLHGYKVQWQQFVGICFGAKHVPFEESCQRTQAYVDQIILPEIRKQEMILAKLQARPASLNYTTVKSVYENHTYKRVEVPITIIAGSPAVGISYTAEYVPSYETVLENYVHDTETTIRWITSDLQQLQARIAGWKPAAVRPVTEKIPCQHEELVYTPRPYDENYETEQAKWHADGKRYPQWFDVHCAECKVKFRSTYEQV